MVKKLIFIALIILGISLRFAALGKVPEGLFADEVAIGLNAKLIAETGHDEYGKKLPFAFESFSDYKFPGYIYATALAYKLFGPSLITIRLASFLSGLVTIFLVGLIAREIFPKSSVYLLAIAILATNPLHIHYSSIAYETNLALMFLALFLLSIVKICKKENFKIYLILGIISIVAGTWTYHAEVLIFPLISIFLLGISFFIKDKSIDAKLLRLSAFVFILTSIFAYVPFFLNPEMNKRPISYLIDQDSSFNPLAKFEVVASSFLRTFNLEFLFFKGDLFAYRNGVREYGIFPLILLIPLGAGLTLLFRKLSWEAFTSIFLLGILVISILPSALSSSVPYATRLLAFLIPSVLIISLGAQYLLDKYLKNRFLQILVFLVFIFQFMLFAHIYFVHFERGSRHEFPGVSVNLAQTVSQLIQQNKKVYFLNGNSCIPWGNDVLELWYFSNLQNDQMVQWNTDFRRQRIEQDNHAVVFDSLAIPQGKSGNVIINPTQDEMALSEKGSIHVRCTTQGNFYNPSTEKLIKRFYMYPEYDFYEIYTISEEL